MLTERELLILQTIIDDFIDTAHPVGSRAISKKENISISAATIRNVMADLQDMDLLEKTHSSSGRVPSEKGYRYYVDHVISPTIKEIEGDIIKNLMQDELLEYEQIVQMSADVLSQLTNYTTIILGTNVENTRLKQIQIVTLSAQAAVAILVTDSGHVEHKGFTIPPGINAADIEKMVNILNDRLVGVPITQLTYKLKTEVHALLRKHIQNYESMGQYLKHALTFEDTAKLYVGGQSNVLIQPEFKDVDKVYGFYNLMENEDALIELLKDSRTGVTVTIGEENENEAIKHFSLITSAYTLGLDQLGTIALLGPTRMEYRKVITLLKGLSSEMSQLLQSRDSNLE